MIFYSRENNPLVINKGFALTLVFLELKKSTFFRIILRHTWPRDRTDILEENLRVLKTKKRFCKILTSLNFEYIYYTLYYTEKNVLYTL